MQSEVKDLICHNETPIFAWDWNKGQIQIGPILALRSPHSLKAHVRLRLNGSLAPSNETSVLCVGKMLHCTTRWTSQIFLRTMRSEITNNDAIWIRTMAFFLSSFIYCRKCRQNTQTLLTAESGTHGNLDLFLGVSKEHYHADDDVTINIKRIPLVVFFKVD